MAYVMDPYLTRPCVQHSKSTTHWLHQTVLNIVLVILVDLRYYTGSAGLTVATRPRPGELSMDLVSR